MNPSIRIAMFAVGAAVLAVTMLIGMLGMPPFGAYKGPYGDLVIQSVVRDRHVQEAPTAVTLDYRGFDTLNEEYILFCSVTAVSLLLRTQREEHEQSPRDRGAGRPLLPINEAVAVLGALMFPVLLLFGLYIVFHGHLTPGGGFQGGVIVAGAFLCIYLSGEPGALERAAPPAVLEPLESVGVGGYVVTGLLGVFAGTTVLQNVLPFGQTGSLLSGGMLPLLNLVVGLAVAAGFVLMLLEFLKQTVQTRRSGS